MSPFRPRLATGFLAGFLLAGSCGDGVDPFTGLGAPVEVRRDTLGIPHIYAESHTDAFYAAGYLQATDRLFQMEAMRRNALGRAAEVFGSGYVDQDRLIRILDIPRWGRETAALTRREAPRDAVLADAWIAGVNARIAEVLSGASPMPYGFAELGFVPETWTVEDSLAVSRLVMFQNGQQLEHDALASILRLVHADLYAVFPLIRSFDTAPALPPEDIPAGANAAVAPLVAPAPGTTARRVFPKELGDGPLVRGIENLRPTNSNNWAVDGRFTHNGRPLIAGDPHQGLQTPNVLWAHHLHTRSAGGTFDVIGFGFVGTPGIQLGHTDRVAWTATVAYPDISDLVEVGAPFEGRIDLGTRTVPVEHRVETIAVKDAAPVVVDAYDVPGYGVLLPDDLFPFPLAGPGSKVLLQWAGFRPSRDAIAFLGFDRARSVADFDRALRSLEQGTFNWIYADANDIAYRVSCLVPDRGVPSFDRPPYALLSGLETGTFWSGRFLSRDKLPHSRGGARGFLVSANSDPFGFVANGRVDDDPYYYGGFFDPGARTQRIVDELTRLTAHGDVSADDMKALQRDVYSRYASVFVPMLLEAHAKVGSDPSLAAYEGRADLDALVAELAAWDYRYTRESSAAVVSEAFMGYFARDVLADDFGSLYTAITSSDSPTIYRLLGIVARRQFEGADALMEGGRDALAMQALAEAAAWLETRFGSLDPAQRAWGMVHGASLRSIRAGLPGYEIPWTSSQGTNSTVDVANTRFFDGNGQARMRLDAGSGAVYRMVASFDPDGTPRAEIVFVPGNVGEPSDPHFADLHADWIDGVYHPLPFRRADVEAATESTFSILP